ncbi:hypothetical protein ACFQ1S_04830 [Kibdelosporangium lantanae]|uniref:DeoR-like transcriptional repressor C-terminal sensor domain-containing protein n=1 Tax=Kibdelosporangium lantanae TaxID=1497396 RepID=A0ABW3M4E9_9PSEU
MFSSTPKLESLLMNTGTVTEFVSKETWTTLAATLKKVFYDQYAGTFEEEDIAGYTAELCTVYHRNKEPHRRIRYLARQKAFGEDNPDVDKYLDASTEQKVCDMAAKFVDEFIDRNGQWAYIRQQPWYESGEYVIAVDVNYYPNRAGIFKYYPIFHKDTGGNNIFVNLVFDNDSVIEATEWYTDLALPSDKRAAWQKALLPETHLTALERARKALADKAKAAAKDKDAKPEVVKGGVTDTVYTYVSWVDDLVWHATPIDLPRIEMTQEIARHIHQPLDAAHTEARFVYFDDDAQVRSNIEGLEIIGTMSELPGPHLSKWLKINLPKVQDIDEPMAKQVWHDLYHGNGGADRVFLGTDGFSEQRGLCSPSLEQAHLKHAMLHCARHAYVLVDRSKMGQEPFHYWTPLDRAHTVLTNNP